MGVQERGHTEHATAKKGKRVRPDWHPFDFRGLHGPMGNLTDCSSVPRQRQYVRSPCRHGSKSTRYAVLEKQRA